MEKETKKENPKRIYEKNEKQNLIDELTNNLTKKLPKSLTNKIVEIIITELSYDKLEIYAKCIHNLIYKKIKGNICVIFFEIQNDTEYALIAHFLEFCNIFFERTDEKCHFSIGTIKNNKKEICFSAFGGNRDAIYQSAREYSYSNFDAAKKLLTVIENYSSNNDSHGKDLQEITPINPVSSKKYVPIELCVRKEIKRPQKTEEIFINVYSSPKDKFSNSIFQEKCKCILETPLNRGEKKSRNALVSNQESDFLLGCKLENVHVRLGAKIHIENFYEAEILFHNANNIKNFAFLIAEDIEAQFKKNGQQYEGIYLVGYESYSELLVRQIEFLLRNRGYAIVSNFYFNDDEDKKNNKDDRRYMPVLIVPVGSTLSTFYKIMKEFGIKITSDIYHYVIVLVRDKYDEESEIEKEFWKLEGNIARLKLAYNGEIDANGNQQHLKVKYLLDVDSKWQKAQNCQLCHPKMPVEEQTILHVNKTSTLPKMVFDLFSSNRKGFNKAFLGNLQKFDNNTKRLSHLDKCIKYGHIENENNHFIYYINTKDYVKEVKGELIEWARHLRITFQEEYDFGNRFNILVSPLNSTNGDFLSIILNELFGPSYRYFHFSIKDSLREDVRAKFKKITQEFIFNDEYSKMYNENSQKINCFYIDDIIVSGESYDRSRSLIKMLLEEGGVAKECIFNAIITLINRNSYDSVNHMISQPGKNFYSFLHLNIPTLKKSKGKCPNCDLDQAYKNIMKCTVDENLKKLFRDCYNRQKLCTIPEYNAQYKTKEEVEKQLKKSFQRLKHTHIINSIFDDIYTKIQYANKNDLLQKIISSILKVIYDEITYIIEKNNKSTQEVMMFWSDSETDSEPLVINKENRIEIIEIIDSYFKVVSRPMSAKSYYIRNAVLKLTIYILEAFNNMENISINESLFDTKSFEIFKFIIYIVLQNDNNYTFQYQEKEYMLEEVPNRQKRKLYFNLLENISFLDSTYAIREDTIKFLFGTETGLIDKFAAEVIKEINLILSFIKPSIEKIIQLLNEADNNALENNEKLIVKKIETITIVTLKKMKKEFSNFEVEDIFKTPYSKKIFENFYVEEIIRFVSEAKGTIKKLDDDNFAPKINRIKNEKRLVALIGQQLFDKLLKQEAIVFCSNKIVQLIREMNENKTEYDKDFLELVIIEALSKTKEKFSEVKLFSKAPIVSFCVEEIDKLKDEKRGSFVDEILKIVKNATIREEEIVKSDVIDIFEKLKKNEATDSFPEEKVNYVKKLKSELETEGVRNENFIVDSIAMKVAETIPRKKDSIQDIIKEYFALKYKFIAKWAVTYNEEISRSVLLEENIKSLNSQDESINKIMQSLWIENTTILYNSVQSLVKKIKNESGEFSNTLSIEIAKEKYDGYYRYVKDLLEKNKDIINAYLFFSNESSQNEFSTFYNYLSEFLPATLQNDDGKKKLITDLIGLFISIELGSVDQEVKDLRDIYRSIASFMINVTFSDAIQFLLVDESNEDKNQSIPTILWKLSEEFDIIDNDVLLKVLLAHENIYEEFGENKSILNTRGFYKGSYTESNSNEKIHYVSIRIPIQLKRENVFEEVIGEKNSIRIILYYNDAKKTYIENDKELLYRVKMILFLKSKLIEIFSKDYAKISSKSKEYYQIKPFNSDPIRILHLTDIHFEEDNQAIIQSCLEKLFMRFINGSQNDKKPDLVVITGDIINIADQAIALEKRYKNFLEIFKFLLAKIYEDEWDERVLIVPGNHDYSSMNEGISQNTARNFIATIPPSILSETNANIKFAYYLNFASHFMKQLRETKVLENDLCFISPFKLLNLNFILLNTASMASSNRQNRVGIKKTVLNHINKELEENENQGLLNIALMHHTPAFKNDYLVDKGGEVGKVMQPLIQLFWLMIQTCKSFYIDEDNPFEFSTPFKKLLWNVYSIIIYLSEISKDNEFKEMEFQTDYPNKLTLLSLADNICIKSEKDGKCDTLQLINDDSFESDGKTIENPTSYSFFNAVKDYSRILNEKAFLKVESANDFDDDGYKDLSKIYEEVKSNLKECLNSKEKDEESFFAKVRDIYKNKKSKGYDEKKPEEYEDMILKEYEDKVSEKKSEIKEYYKFLDNFIISIDQALIIWEKIHLKTDDKNTSVDILSDISRDYNASNEAEVNLREIQDMLGKYKTRLILGGHNHWTKIHNPREDLKIVEGPRFVYSTKTKNETKEGIKFCNIEISKKEKDIKQNLKVELEVFPKEGSEVIR